jgi:hypothetical protein
MASRQNSSDCVPIDARPASAVIESPQQGDEMEVRAGTRVWIPCEVKPGPFSNERMVRVVGDSQEYVNFVQVHLLREAIERGTTFVLATIDSIREDECIALLPGENLGSRYFHGRLSQVMPVGAVEA